MHSKCILLFTKHACCLSCVASGVQLCAVKITTLRVFFSAVTSEWEPPVADVTYTVINRQLFLTYVCFVGQLAYTQPHT